MRCEVGGMNDEEGNMALVSGQTSIFTRRKKEPGAATTQLLRTNRRKFNPENQRPAIPGKDGTKSTEEEMKMKRNAITGLLLVIAAACSPISQQAQRDLAKPINCSTAEGDIRVLQSEKAL